MRLPSLKLPRKRPGLLFTLVGPAGAGKNRLMAYILEHTRLRQLPTATTRAIRPGEQEGREHLFVSRAHFEQMIEADELLEHQVIHGNLYGIPRAAVESALDSGEALIADIEVYGAARAREAYPDNVVSIFIQPPSIGTLIQRMRDRGEREGEIGKRLLRVPLEIEYAEACHYVILNDSLDHAEDLLYRIVAAELDDSAERVSGDTLIVYHFRYLTQVILTYGDEVLRNTTAPADLTAPFSRHDLPHTVALRLVETAFGFAAPESSLRGGDKPDGSYLPPALLEYTTDDAIEQVIYVYLYALDKRIPAPGGWAWQPIETLPEPMRSLRAEQTP